MVELSCIFLKCLENRNFEEIETVISVIGVLFPFGDKFKSIQPAKKDIFAERNIYYQLCNKFLKGLGFSLIRKYWEMSKKRRPIPFITLYLSLKPFKSV
jgi:hypothetical protein